jgi:hypothetical protein
MYSSTAVWRPMWRCNFATAPHFVSIVALWHYGFHPCGTWRRVARLLVPDISKERGVFEASEGDCPVTQRHVPAEPSALPDVSPAVPWRWQLSATTANVVTLGLPRAGTPCPVHATCPANLIHVFEGCGSWSYPLGSSLLPPVTFPRCPVPRHPQCSSL